MNEDEAVKWEENIRYQGGWFVVDAKSYNDWVKKLYPVPEGIHPVDTTDWEKESIPVNSFRYFFRVMPPERDWENPPSFMDHVQGVVTPSGKRRTRLMMYLRGKPVGWVSFTDNIITPILTAKDKFGKWETWMSMTPNEIISQRSGLRHARGHVLIGGMGMGWFARRVAERDKVKSVTVVEREKAVAGYFGRHITTLSKPTAKKLTVIVDDVWDFLKGDRAKVYDSILLDIWPRGGMGDVDPKTIELQKRHANVWAWY